MSWDGLWRSRTRMVLRAAALAGLAFAITGCPSAPTASPSTSASSTTEQVPIDLEGPAEGNGYTILVPDGWEDATSASTIRADLLYAPTASDSPATLSVRVDEEQTLELAEVAAQVQNVNASQLSDYEVLSAADTSEDDRESYDIEARFNGAEPLHQVQRLVLQEDRLYTIAVTAAEDEWSSLSPMLMEALDSFTLDEFAGAPDQGSEEPEPADEPTESGDAIRVGQSGLDDGVRFKVMSLRKEASIPREYDDPLVPPKGADMWIATIIVRNERKSGVDPFCGGTGSILIDDDDRNFEAVSDSISIRGNDEGYCGPNIQPGFRATVKIAYFTPRGVKVAGLSVWNPDSSDYEGASSLFFAL